MTKLQRVHNIITALFLFFFAGLGLYFSKYGLVMISIMIFLTLSLSAIRELLYYFRMARYMVGGKVILYRALIRCDLAAFTSVIASIPPSYILIYLSIFFGFSGLVDLLRALESRRTGSVSWKLSAFHGLFNVIMAVLCLIFIRTGRLVEILYCISLVNSAILRLISAFRRTAVIYIA